MKNLRLFIALAFAAALVTPFLRAGDEKAKEKAEACCSCPKDKDGKECGKDKECCCKAKEKGADKKSEEKE